VLVFAFWVILARDGDAGFCDTSLLGKAYVNFEATYLQKHTAVSMKKPHCRNPHPGENVRFRLTGTNLLWD